jgi:hypothetical protein
MPHASSFDKLGMLTIRNDGADATLSFLTLSLSKGEGCA